MRNDPKNLDVRAADRQDRAVQAETQGYDAPALFVIGRSKDLLQGSGRHKNDDTYRPGFVVDQH